MSTFTEKSQVVHLCFIDQVAVFHFSEKAHTRLCFMAVSGAWNIAAARSWMSRRCRKAFSRSFICSLSQKWRLNDHWRCNRCHRNDHRCGDDFEKNSAQIMFAHLLMFSLIHMIFSFLLVFTFKPKCFWFQCERVPLRPVGCGRLMGAWMLKSRGVCCIARLYRGQPCFYPWHGFWGPFGGSLSRSK